MNLDWEWSHTIHALATPSGTSALAIVRVSGPNSERILRSCAPFLPETLESHTCKVGYFKNPKNNKQVDQVVINYFKKGNSFTGEDLFEINCHGSPIVIDEIFECLADCGSKAAKPGEFSFRAFCNGRIDLVQAESIQDLIMSKTRSQKDLNLRNLNKKLSQSLLEIKGEVLKVIAHLEAKIDFDEEDIVTNESASLVHKLSTTKKVLDEWVENSMLTDALVEPIKICILGQPNTGKSTLYNKLLNEERSIVNEEAGTTRDYVSSSVFKFAAHMQFIDTAGIRETKNSIEAEGIRRSFEQAKTADLLLLVIDCSQENLDEQIISLINFLLNSKLDNKTNVSWVLNKSDISESHSVAKAKASIENYRHNSSTNIFIGHKESKELYEQLWKTISDHAKLQNEFESGIFISSRNRNAIQQMSHKLAESISLLNATTSEDIVIAPLMEFLSLCNEILGLETNEEVIDKIFSEFCLGK